MASDLLRKPLVGFDEASCHIGEDYMAIFGEEYMVRDGTELRHSMPQVSS